MSGWTFWVIVTQTKTLQLKSCEYCSLLLFVLLCASYVIVCFVLWSFSNFHQLVEIKKCQNTFYKKLFGGVKQTLQYTNLNNCRWYSPCCSAFLCFLWAHNIQTVPATAKGINNRSTKQYSKEISEITNDVSHNNNHTKNYMILNIAIKIN